MERDDMGRFVAQVKAKGAEAMSSISKAKGEETVAEESAEHGVELDEPLESHEGKETPAEEAAEEREIAKKYGAQKGKYGKWSMEKKAGW